jgi:uncharacterized glyoxalase superfamily protein PhnB
VAELPDVAPMVSYENVGAAADWLCSVFGFTELARFQDGERVTHVNLAAGQGVVMAGWPGPSYRSPRSHRRTCREAQEWLDSPFVVDGVYVRVHDIEGHYDRARGAGAVILSALEDNEAIGQRQYRVEDIEGHRWMFAGPL